MPKKSRDGLTSVSRTNENMKLYKKSAISKLRLINRRAKKYFNTKERLDFEKTNWGIAGNTFRAYVKYKKQPSLIYREWAKETVTEANFLKKLNCINKYDEFLKVHKYLQGSLDRFWKREQGKSLTFSQRNKIIDLFIKFLSKSEIEEFHSLNQILLEFGHIPLDKFTLLAVKDCFYGIVLAPNPSMGDIRETDTYDFIQNQIRELMIDAKLPNLFFDYYAWNLQH